MQILHWLSFRSIIFTGLFSVWNGDSFVISLSFNLQHSESNVEMQIWYNLISIFCSFSGKHSLFNWVCFVYYFQSLYHVFTMLPGEVICWWWFIVIYFKWNRIFMLSAIICVNFLLIINWTNTYSWIYSSMLWWTWDNGTICLYRSSLSNLDIRVHLIPPGILLAVFLDLSDLWGSARSWLLPST